MSQTTSADSFGFADLVRSVLGDVARALSAGEMTEAGKVARAQGAIEMAMGLFPANVMQMMMAGQAVMLHSLTADAVCEILGSTSGMRPAQMRSGATATARVAAKHLETLIKLQGEPPKGWRTPPPAEEFAPKPPIETPPADNEVGEAAPSESPDLFPIDENYVETVMATPADLMALGIPVGPESVTDATLLRREVHVSDSELLAKAISPEPDAEGQCPVSNPSSASIIARAD